MRSAFVIAYAVVCLVLVLVVVGLGVWLGVSAFRWAADGPQEPSSDGPQEAPSSDDGPQQPASDAPPDGPQKIQSSDSVVTDDESTASPAWGAYQRNDVVSLALGGPAPTCVVSLQPVTPDREAAAPGLARVQAAVGSLSAAVQAAGCSAAVGPVRQSIEDMLKGLRGTTDPTTGAPAQPAATCGDMRASVAAARAQSLAALLNSTGLDPSQQQLVAAAVGGVFDAITAAVCDPGTPDAAPVDVDRAEALAYGALASACDFSS